MRVALPGNLSLYGKLGYRVTGEYKHDRYEWTTQLAIRKSLHERQQRSPTQAVRKHAASHG